MPKYVGYAQDLALAQDADGNVAQWYHPGDDVSPDEATMTWLINQGHTFDPMPEVNASIMTFEGDEGSGPAMISPTQAGAMAMGVETAPATPPAESQGGGTPAPEQQPAQ